MRSITKTCLGLSLLSLSTAWAADTNSLCTYLDNQGKVKCQQPVEMLGSQENLDKYFIKMDEYHAGNNEQQMYKPDHVIWNNSDKTVSLIAEAKESEGHPFTSGELKTVDNFAITQDDSKNNIVRGAIEISASIPYDHGRWPALWMMPHYDDRNNHTWPSGMELDILEFMRPPFSVIGTIHYGLEGEGIPSGASWNFNNNEDLNYSPAQSIDQNMHTYGLEWNVQDNESTLTWYFDGNPYFQIDMKKNNDQYSAMMRVLPSGAEKELVCSQWTNRCPSNYGVTLSQAAYQSFMQGFNSGYYLKINMAVGGNGVAPEPNPNAFPKTEMKISKVTRYTIG